MIKNRVQKTFWEAYQKSIASLFSKDFLNEETAYELNKIEEMEDKLSRDDLIYKIGEALENKMMHLNNK